MYKKSIVVVLLMITSLVKAQLGGEQAYQFLNTTVSPIQAALGGNNVTMYNNYVSQPLYNPAALNGAMSDELSFNYARIFQSVNSGMVAYAKKLNNNRNIHVGVTYLDYGSVDGFDEYGNTTGEFSGSDVALSMGYSYPVENTGLNIGSNLKFISSTLESYSSYALAADFGALYVHPDSGYNIGLTIRNVGTQLKSFDEVREKIPMNITLGVSKQLKKVPIRWHLTLENLQQPKIAFVNSNRTETELDGTINQEKISFFQHSLRHVIVGAELFTNKKFNIRLSYNFRRAEELKLIQKRTFSGLSAGLSMSIKRFRIAYTFSRVTLASDTHFVGCAVKL